ncbi:hypothetical protein NP569_26220, partial [Vibrio parahaemolyticus]|nr:hypothetical protein [Vibrio parahaemolyticus]
VDNSRRDMDEHTKPTEGALAVDQDDKVGRYLDALHTAGDNEIAGEELEGVAFLVQLDSSGETPYPLMVEADIDGGGLDSVVT